MIHSSSRIEFYGAPRVGKSTLYRLVAAQLTFDGLVVPVKSLGPLKRPLERRLDAALSATPELSSLLENMMSAMAEGDVDAWLRMTRISRFVIALRRAAQADLEKSRHVFFDESLCQRGLSVGMSVRSWESIVDQYFETIPIPALLFVLNASRETLLRRAGPRSRHAPYFDRALAVIERSVPILRRRGTRVVEIDAEQTVETNLESVLREFGTLGPTTAESVGAAAVRDKYRGSVAANYDQRRTGDAKWRREAEIVDALLAEAAPKSVLDVPVGTGRFVPLYQARAVKVTGLDASPDMLDIAGHAAAEAGLEFEPQRGDILDLDYQDGSFDCVVCVRLLNWFNGEEMSRAIKEIVRVSRRYVIVSIRTADNLLQTKPFGPGKVWVHPSALVVSAIEKAGAEVSKAMKVNRSDRGEYKILLLEKTV